MKTINKFVIILCSCILTCCLIILIFLLASGYRNSIGEFASGNKTSIGDTSFLYKAFVFQLILHSLSLISVVVYLLYPLYRKTRSSDKTISKIVLLSDANEPADEFLLLNRKSAMIVRQDFVYISLENDVLVDEYAVINRVDSDWYIERISEKLVVGLRRAGEQYVYKLKPGVFYKMCANDTIYIEKERLLLV